MTRMRADLLLVARGLFASRAKAQEAIVAGLVRADERLVARPSDMLDESAAIDAEAPYPWVSRGGVKLAAALDHFAIAPEGLRCLDVGASTGGFTEVLLARGAREVVAVDVGHGQLHQRLADDPRVTSLEGTDARALSPELIGGPVHLAVIDVSFISLALVLPAVPPVMAAGGTLIALIKPQFEAGRADVRKGVVRDEAVHARVVGETTQRAAERGLIVRGIIPSPISGGDGNREFLFAADALGAPQGATGAAGDTACPTR